MKKRIFYFLWLMILLLIPVSIHSQNIVMTSNGLCFNYVSQSNRTVKVTYYGNSYVGNTAWYTESTYDIPSTITWQGVTYTVTGIGENAFRGTNIQSITLPNTVTFIEGYAFEGCKRLPSIEIPKSVTSIGNNAFCNCSALKSLGLLLSSSLSSIGDNAFNGCSVLPSIVFPKSLTEVGKDAFVNCSNLKTIFVNDIASWCRIDFQNLRANPLVNNRAELKINNQIVKNITIPEGIEYIGMYTFACDVKCEVYNYYPPLSGNTIINKTLVTVNYSSFAS